MGFGLNNNERSVHVTKKIRGRKKKIHYPIRTREMGVGPAVVCARVGSSDPQLVSAPGGHVPPCRVGRGPTLRCVVPSSSPTCGLPSLLTPFCGPPHSPFARESQRYPTNRIFRLPPLAPPPSPPTHKLPLPYDIIILASFIVFIY